MIAGIFQFQSSLIFYMIWIWIFWACSSHWNIAFILFQRVFVPEEADFGSRHQMGHVSELQNNYAQHEVYKNLCTRSEEHQLTSDVHKKSSMRRCASKKNLESHCEERAHACEVWRDPSGCSKLTLKVTDLASLLFNMRLNRQEIRTTFADKRKTASIHYECKGTWHYASKCPAREKRRGRTKNSPGKSNPSKISLLKGDRLNPDY
jgi:hypothetical protein